MDETRGNSPVVLSPEQQHVMYLVSSGRSVFFTGPAGTGKSVLLREIIKELRPDPSEVNGVAVTASTGIAALHIGGMTLHSFAGIRLGKGRVEKLVRQIKRKINILMRWRTTRVLIIDESQFESVCSVWGQC
ncbi:hypothetical protein BDN70DRAFT_69016 [Pholiota conissans]|uniref:ATP-dependent DNA helicase n=1 Tax=Pholiota conissans TaxID=109636 RepID=A0A9P5YYC6_9AGAR|nr:hypothetical protein BDN70DRAFT_69016 [Pholiota conissans]